MKKFLCIIFLLIIILINHEEVMSGTQTGLLLWYQNLIPALLPFILITNTLCETNAYQELLSKIPKRYTKQSAILIAIILGNLCGYPIGGKILSDLKNNGYIDSNDTTIYLSVASQASPMFLLGYVYQQILHRYIPLYILVLSIYIPTFLLLLYKIIHHKNNLQPISINNKIILKPFVLTQTFLHTTQTMVFIGLYVIIFSIINNILTKFLSSTKSIILFSYLEITNGLSTLLRLSIPIPAKIAFIASLSSFGGLCSTFQIKSVFIDNTMNIKKYLIDKLALSLGTFFIIWIYYLIKD